MLSITECDVPKECFPRGIVDRLDDEIARLKERLARLEKAKAAVDKNPEIAGILNELTKLL